MTTMVSGICNAKLGRGPRSRGGGVGGVHNAASGAPGPRCRRVELFALQLRAVQYQQQELQHKTQQLKAMLQLHAQVLEAQCHWAQL